MVMQQYNRKSISEESRRHIIENNEKISALLAENERILKKEGFNPPVVNFGFDEKEEQKLRIQFPPRYIRKKEYFIQAYRLDVICGGDNSKVTNIAYSLQASDFYNFILNRLGLFGSIQSMMYKQATINIVSIIEALIKNYADAIHNKCKACSNKMGCYNQVSNSHISCPFQKQVEFLKDKQILVFEKECSYENVKDMYNYRNTIHLTKNETSPKAEASHSVQRYNKAVFLLKEVRNSMIEQIDWRSGDANCRFFKQKE